MARMYKPGYPVDKADYTVIAISPREDEQHAGMGTRLAALIETTIPGLQLVGPTEWRGSDTAVKMIDELGCHVLLVYPVRADGTPWEQPWDMAEARVYNKLVIHQKKLVGEIAKHYREGYDVMEVIDGDARPYFRRAWRVNPD
jgi:hypothetical protein